jgi:hypothetical protein
MPLITITTGQNPLIYTGVNPLTLSTAPWYTSANISKVFAVSPNGLGYASGQPGSQFGVTTLTAAAANTKPTGFILVAKQPFTVDGTQFGIEIVALQANFPVGQTSQATMRITAATAGVYNLGTSTGAGITLAGLSGLAYTRAGQALTGATTLAANDVVVVTATAGSTTDGLLTLTKQ